jgi:hypothetical protein
MSSRRIVKFQVAENNRKAVNKKKQSRDNTKNLPIKVNFKLFDYTVDFASAKIFSSLNQKFSSCRSFSAV